MGVKGQWRNGKPNFPPSFHAAGKRDIFFQSSSCRGALRLSMRGIPAVPLSVAEELLHNPIVTPNQECSDEDCTEH